MSNILHMPQLYADRKQSIKEHLQKHIQIYSVPVGQRAESTSSLPTRHTATRPRAMVFDVDETLGYFGQLGIWCDALESYYRKSDISYKIFNELMEMYPEVLRPLIVKIMEYVYLKKRDGMCTKVLIYTNNQAEPEWVRHITKYLEHKLKQSHPEMKSPFIDQIIGAFKINGKVVEPCRTTNDKTMSDLMRCARLPQDVEVCFLEDSYFEQMRNDAVYYIKIKPYRCHISFKTMLDRFVASSLFSKMPIMAPAASPGDHGLIIGHFRDEMMKTIKERVKTYNYHAHYKTEEEQDIDVIISKGIMENMRKFFKDNNRKIIKYKGTRRLNVGGMKTNIKSRLHAVAKAALSSKYTRKS